MGALSVAPARATPAHPTDTQPSLKGVQQTVTSIGIRTNAQANYGKKDKECVAAIKQIYKEIGVEAKFKVGGRRTPLARSLLAGIRVVPPLRDVHACWLAVWPGVRPCAAVAVSLTVRVLRVCAALPPSRTTRPRATRSCVPRSTRRRHCPSPSSRRCSQRSTSARSRALLARNGQTDKSMLTPLLLLGHLQAPEES